MKDLNRDKAAAPETVFILSTDQKLSAKLKKALLIRENKQNSGSPQLDTDNICRVFQNSLAHEEQRPKKPGTSSPVMSQVLRVTHRRCNPIGTCLRE